MPCKLIATYNSEGNRWSIFCCHIAPPIIKLDTCFIRICVEMITDHTSWFPCAIYIQGFQCLHAFVFRNYILLELVCRWPHLILKFTWQISSLIQCHNVTLREDCCDNLIPMQCTLWKNMRMWKLVENRVEKDTNI
jgi:hypothetical protein